MPLRILMAYEFRLAILYIAIKITEDIGSCDGGTSRITVD